MGNRKSAKKRKERFDKGGPFINVRDFSSSAPSTREVNDNGDMQVYLSDLEINVKDVFYYLNPVIEYQTQIALDQPKTIEICKRLNIKHPTDDEGLLTIMSTDLVMICDFKGQVVKDAICIKPSSHFTLPMMNRFDIELTYHEDEGTRWRIVTEREIDPIVLKNVIEIRDFKEKPDNYLEFIRDNFSHAPDRSIKLGHFFSSITQERQVLEGDCVRSFYHLLATRQISGNLFRKIDLHCTLSEFKLYGY